VKQTQGKVWAGVLLALGCAGIVWAGVALEGYRPLVASPGEIRGAALDGDDSVNWATPLSTSGTTISVFNTSGNPTVAVSPRFSVDGGACQIKVGLYRYNGTTYDFMGVASVTTETAKEQLVGAATWLTEQPVFVDTSGATHYEIRITDPTPAGTTVSIRAWTFGAQSESAE